MVLPNGGLYIASIEMFRFMLLSFFSLVTAQATVRVCDDSAVFKVESLTFSPTNPTPGTSGTFTNVFNVPYQINNGKSTYNCVLNGLPVWSETYDLCTQITCPITAGSHTTIGEAAIPDVSGKLDCKIRWFDGDITLMCVEFILKLGNLRGLPWAKGECMRGS